MIWEQKVATVVMLTNLKERKEVSNFTLFFLCIYNKLKNSRDLSNMTQIDFTVNDDSCLMDPYPAKFTSTYVFLE